MALNSQIAIGIDLGTTFSCVGYFINDRVDIIENKTSGLRITPSVVNFNDTSFTVGKSARISENSVYEIKRIIGKSFEDESVQRDIEKWSFKVINDSLNKKPKIQVNYKNSIQSYYPEQISAMVLTEIKKIASLHLNQDVTKAVITVPAYFNDSQRQATKDAGKIAGLEVLKIINEPTAAALAYGYNKNFDNKSIILIYDLGGGTFDVSIMEINKGEFKVLGIGGDTNLGGTDFDDRLVYHFMDIFKKKYNGDITYNKKAIQRLRAKCEEVKRELSQVNETDIEIDSLVDGQDFIEKITRATFENINKDLFEKTIKITKQTLESCNLDKNEINDVVLIGGSSRIPKIQSLLNEFFEGKNIKQSINPDEAVAYGAAIQAQLLTGPKPPSIRNIIDIIPKSIGIKLLNGSMSFFFKKFTSIPNKLTKEYTTSEDNQKAVRFGVYEGEQLLARNNTLLGEFCLGNIRDGPAGVPKLDCTFEIDQNGILNVTAKDRDTLSTNQITITKIKDSLNDQQINQMVNDMKSILN